MKIHRLTKAVLSVALGVLIAFSTCVFALAQGVVIKGVPDGQNKSTVMDEHFYSGSLEPNFTSNTVSVKTDSYGMHFTGAYHYGSALVLVPYKLKDYNKFTFSIDLLQTNDGFIYCGFGGENEKTNVSKYDFNLCVSKEVTALYEMGGLDNWKSIGNTPLNNAFVAGKMTDFAITLERASGNTFKVNFEILEGNNPIFATDYSTVVRMEHPYGHFCMWGGMNEVFDIHDFKVYDTPTHLAFSDDFADSSITYGDEPAGNSSWHVNETGFTRDELFIARNAGPEFKNANDGITANSKLVLCDKVSKPYKISFKTKITSLQKNSTFGLYLGADKTEELSKVTVIGISAYDDNFASVNLIRNGKISDYGENLISISELNIGESFVDFEVVIYSDHTVDFTVGGIKFDFNNIKYEGFWGICNYSFDNRSASTVRLDEVKLVKNTYSECTQPDLSNDFAGIKLTQDGFEEYYISDRTYYIGPGVSLRPKGAFTTEPSLYFENAGPYSSFSPKQKYTDFILQFDVKMVSQGTNGQWFGVNFGKESYASIADSSTSINFEYYAWDTVPYTQMTANLCTFDDGKKAKKIEDYHFYKDQDTKYNFMIVAKNRTVYVYFKEDSEDISKLGICRAVITDVNTAGYVSIFGLNSLSFDIFNYKLTNIAEEATEDSQIALRESFEKEKLSDKLVGEGSFEVKDGNLKLSSGNIGMKNPSRYYIANFTLLQTNSDLSVSLTDNKSLTISKDLKKITVNDGAKKSVFDVSKYNLADYKNAQVQLILQYDALSVAAKGIYEPCDKLSSPIAEYTFANPVEEGYLSISSEDASLDNLSVYSLDNTYKAQSVSYEQDPNDVDMWTKKANVKNAKSSTVANKSNEISTLFIVLYSIIGVIILVLLGFIVTLFIKKRGKKQ